MDILNRKFSANSVALATGATSKQITDWCNQGLIMGQREPLGRGHRREFSFFNVMEIALALELVEIGVRAPGDAFRAAQRVSHTGDGDFEWAEDEGVRDKAPHRWPGLPFHYSEGDTFAFVAGSKSTVAIGDSLKDVLRALGQPAGFIALNVSAVFHAVMLRMALSSAEVLDEIYEGAID